MRGFAGLNNFATDVDAAIAEADRIASAPRPATTPAPPPRSGPDVTENLGDSGVGRSLKTLGGWAVGIGVILVLKFAIWGGVDAVTDDDGYSYEDTAYESTGSSNYDDQMYSGEEENAYSDGTSEYSDDALAYPDQSGEYYDSAEVPTFGEVVDNATSRPAPGTSQLTRGELRYCMEEMERLDGERSEMESLQYIDVDRFNANVDAFNARNDDLRSTCSGSFLTSDETAVTGELSLRRYSLQQEGRNRVQ